MQCSSFNFSNFTLERAFVKVTVNCSCHKMSCSSLWMAVSIHTKISWNGTLSFLHSLNLEKFFFLNSSQRMALFMPIYLMSHFLYASIKHLLYQVLALTKSQWMAEKETQIVSIIKHENNTNKLNFFLSSLLKLLYYQSVL